MLLKQLLQTLSHLELMLWWRSRRIAAQFIKFDQEEVTKAYRTCTRSRVKDGWDSWDTLDLEFEGFVVDEYGDNLRGRIARDCLQSANDVEGEHG